MSNLLPGSPANADAHAHAHVTASWTQRCSDAPSPQALLHRWAALSVDLAESQVALVHDTLAFVREGAVPQTPLMEQHKLVAAKMELAGELFLRVVAGRAV